MARIAVHTVPDIVPHVGVMRIRLCLGVTHGALEDSVIRRVRMTRRTNARRIAVRSWKPRMIERCPGPARGRMAGFARRRKTGRRMAGIRRS